VLQELRAQNFALFQDIHVSFSPGFTAITGETGSGKSLLVNSLSLLLGKKAEAIWIRKGEGEALVEGAFSLENQEPVKEKLKEKGLPYKEGLLVRRIISRDGRNRIYINDSPVTLHCLQEITQGLVEILSQREGLRLLKASHHLPLLDAFACLEPLVDKYRAAYEKYKSLLREKEVGEKEQEERLRRMDYLAFQIKDIQGANLQPGEEESLRERRDWLRAGEKLKEALTQAAEFLDGEGFSAAQGVRQALSLLSPLAQLKRDLTEEVYGLDETLLRIQESAANLQGLLSQVEVNPQELAQVEERLDLLHRLKTRYGNTIKEILTYLEKAQREFEHLEKAQERGEEIEKEIAEARKEVERLGKELSSKRMEKAKEMEAQVEATLAQLLMEDCRFMIAFREREQPAPQGLEEVAFYIRPNVGEEAKPLNRVASGGELSRITLAIRRVLSDIEGTPVLVLDEIDAGLGGITAHKVGELLMELGGQYQVICVTHLPQVARHSHHQLMVEKKRTGGKTLTQVRELTPLEKEEELKRMMGEEAPLGRQG